MTALRETALAAIAARLTAQVPTATVERARVAPVDTDKENLPRLVLESTDWTADETAEPLAVHYTLAFAVTGYVHGRTGLAVEQGLSELQASTVAALSGWAPSASGLGEAAQEGAEFRLYDAEESARPAGEFTARFSMLCIGPLVA
jgi:hypothetical protein